MYSDSGDRFTNFCNMYSDPGDQNTRPIYGCKDPGTQTLLVGIMTLVIHVQTLVMSILWLCDPGDWSLVDLQGVNDLLTPNTPPPPQI